MNRTACPNGIATDEVFDVVFEECQLSRSTFWYMVLITMVIRCICQAIIITDYNRRKRPQRRDKLLVFTTTSTLLLTVLFTCLVAYNYANAYNGLSFTLYGLIFLSVAMSELLEYYKMVHIGQSIRPLIEEPKNVIQTSTVNSTSHDPYLRVGTSIIKEHSLTTPTFVFLIFHLVILCIIGLIFCILRPLFHLNLLVQIGFSLMTCFQLFVALSSIYQTHCVIQDIQVLLNKIKDDAPRTYERGQSSIHIIQRDQFNLFHLTLLLSSLFFLLVSIHFSSTQWNIYTLWAIGPLWECLSLSLVLFMYWYQRRQLRGYGFKPILSHHQSLQTKLGLRSSWKKTYEPTYLM